MYQVKNNAVWLAAVCLLTLTSPSHAREVWEWKMPGELYRQLNHTQRSQFDKAAVLFGKAVQNDCKANERIRHYRAAALEWQKIRVQIGSNLNDSAMAYVIFMRGHSQRGALDRQQAIRTYTEVIDYFPDEIWIAVPALHFRAESYFSNGDDLLGYKSLQVIAEDKDYLQHPLAAGALRRLAENQWANREFDKAVKTWTTTWENYHKTNSEEANHAAKKLRDAYVVRGNFDELEQFLKQQAGESGETKLLESYLDVLVRTREKLRGGREWRSWYYGRFHNNSEANAMIEETRKTVYDWFIAREDQFKEAGWEYRFLLAQVSYAAEVRVERLEPLVEKVVEIHGERKADIGEVLDRGGRLADTLAGLRERDHASRVFESLIKVIRSPRVPEEKKEKHAAVLLLLLARHDMLLEARSLLDLYTDETRRLWAEFGLYSRERHWPDALAVLDAIEKLEQADDLKKVRECRAEIYHFQTRKYDEAIAVYRQIAQPPRTLWEIQDCERLVGRTDDALRTLTEIAAMFPDEAPEAIFTKAEYYREDGKHELAVALYRQILQRFKKSGQPSAAHQRLEGYNIESGGGVGDELN